MAKMPYIVEMRMEWMKMERTFLMVKPDGVSRQLIGEIVSRFEKKGFRLAGAKLMQISDELAKKHYAEHKERPFSMISWHLLLPVRSLPWFGKAKTSSPLLGK